ncbi:MAG: xanthine dehydrogenase small subunit [Pararhizobium sp.]
MRNTIRFLLNDDLVELSNVGASETLLDFLRLDRRLTGSKEGCAEGDCGACTVLVGRLVGDQVRYETVNACIRFVGSLDATHVVTVEHLAGKGGVLHPVQQALVEEHGSQCGFCTPGFVMSLYSLWLSTSKPTPHQIEKALQGNLCRCTGYQPIIRAAEKMGAARPGEGNDRLTAMRQRVLAELGRLNDGARVEIAHGGERLVVPASVDDLAVVLEAEPKATIVSGSTDVGLWVTKQMRDIAPAVFIGHLAELHRVEADARGVRLFACVSYTEAFAEIAKRFPAMGAYFDRIGGEQVRNMGTIGGNIANGSPIGDTPPPLIALGAELTLRKGTERRTIPLEDFFIAYGKQDRAPGEFVESVYVPALPAGDRFAVYKVTKRRDEDISALSAAFRIALDGDGRVSDVRIAFGGMAATPKRAKTVEAALIGKAWSEVTIEAARGGFDADFQPLTDWRATAEYRMLSAKNLLTRFFLETGGETAQVVRYEAALAEA